MYAQTKHYDQMASYIVRKQYNISLLHELRVNRFRNKIEWNLVVVYEWEVQRYVLSAYEKPRGTHGALTVLFVYSLIYSLTYLLADLLD